MMAERSLSKSHYTPMHLINKNNYSFHPPKKISVSLPTISMSDEEDAHICKHKITIMKAKHVKEEWQRQYEEEAQQAAEAKRVQREVEAEKAQRDTEAKEAQRTAEAEESQRRAKDKERAQKEAKKQKKVEASAAQCKQLELLSQHKVAACIAQEEDAQRALEVSGEGFDSVILGYRKGKAPEK